MALAKQAFEIVGEADLSNSFEAKFRPPVLMKGGAPKKRGSMKQGAKQILRETARRQSSARKKRFHNPMLPVANRSNVVSINRELQGVSHYPRDPLRD